MGTCKEKILQQEELKMKILQDPVVDNNNAVMNIAVTNNQPVMMKKKAGNLPQHAELVNNAA